MRYRVVKLVISALLYRDTAAVRGVAALVAVVAAAGCGGTAAKRHAAAPVRTAALRLVEAQGVTFRGTGFRSGERVRVDVIAQRRWSATVVADSKGVFTVTFPRAHDNACAEFGATAIGNRGSRASFKRAPGECPAP